MIEKVQSLSNRVQEGEKINKENLSKWLDYNETEKIPIKFLNMLMTKCCPKLEKKCDNNNCKGDLKK